MARLFGWRKKDKEDKYRELPRRSVFRGAADDRYFYRGSIPSRDVRLAIYQASKTARRLLTIRITPTRCCYVIEDDPGERVLTEDDWYELEDRLEEMTLRYWAKRIDGTENPLTPARAYLYQINLGFAKAIR